MADGILSKEGMFEILFDELKKVGFNSASSHEIAVNLIDNVIPNDIREGGKAWTGQFMSNVSKALNESSKLYLS